MHLLKTVGISFAAALSIGLTASTVAAADRPQIPFAGTSSGTDTSADPTNPDYTQFHVTADIKGTGSLLGRFTETLDYLATLDAEGAVVEGTGVITAADGSKIYLHFEGTVPGFFQQPFPLEYSETFVITGGTGRFAGASGSGDISGVDYGPQVNMFEQDFEGVLIKAGK